MRSYRRGLRVVSSNLKAMRRPRFVELTSVGSMLFLCLNEWLIFNCGHIMNLNSIRAFFEKGNRAKWFVFTLFCLILFIKTMIFHFSVELDVKHLVSGHVVACFVFWLGKVAPVLFLGSFVFIAKRQWWTIIINVIVDLWAIANLFYFKVNNMFLSVDMVLMVDNLDGFWDSLYSYMGWDIYSFIILSILYALTIILTNVETNRTKILFLIMMSLDLMMVFGINLYKEIKYQQFCNKGNTIVKCCKSIKTYRYSFPFGSVCHYAKNGFRSYDGWAFFYNVDQSFISFFPSSIVYYFVKNNDNIELDNYDIKEIGFMINHSASNVANPITNVIFILFESLESWPIDDTINFCYVPNLKKLSRKNNVLYCDKVMSQVKYGNSIDGQMIVMTGLLPIANGVSSNLHGKNEYPNYVHLFKNSATINPVPGVWNQKTVTQSYQFDTLIEPSIHDDWYEDDKGVFKKIIEYSTTTEEPLCSLGITIYSHPPYTIGSTNPVYIEKDMPKVMSAYLNSLYHTDSCIGKLLDTIFNSHLAENTTIVITGDHTIFRNEIAFSELTQYAQENGIDFKAGHTFTPLIIYSPEIEGNIHVTDTCYQMDVFPTILNLIGVEDYYWHGFGVNVMDSVARHNRPITEQEAYRLSDLMIRSDYFRNYYGK